MSFSNCFTYISKSLWHFGLIALLGLSTATIAHAERNVTLGWNPASSSTAGYFVYFQEENAAPTRIDVGSATQASIGGLKEGLRYSFTVTAYNHYGVESTPSNEASLNVPVPIQLPRPSTPTALKRVRFPVAPGRAYEVEASTDLQSWSTIWQTGVATTYTWIEVPDMQSGMHQSRFYRLKVLRASELP